MYCKTSVSHRPLSLYAFIFLPLILIMVFYSNVLSAQVTLAWDPNNEPDHAGYQVYYGTSSGIYTDSIDVNNSTTYTISDLEGSQTYYFAVTAYNTSGDESGFSNEVSKYLPEGEGEFFEDVPPGHWAEDAIYKIYDARITNSCSQNPLLFCPATEVTRVQMAIFLLKAKYGSSYSPPPATGIFEDVPVTYWAADWIEHLYNEGITKGCTQNPPQYCPESSVTRAQMAVFLVRTFDL